MWRRVRSRLRLVRGPSGTSPATDVSDCHTCTASALTWRLQLDKIMFDLTGSTYPLRLHKGQESFHRHWQCNAGNGNVSFGSCVRESPTIASMVASLAQHTWETKQDMVPRRQVHTEVASQARSWAFHLKRALCGQSGYRSGQNTQPLSERHTYADPRQYLPQTQQH